MTHLYQLLAIKEQYDELLSEMIDSYQKRNARLASYKDSLITGEMATVKGLLSRIKEILPITSSVSYGRQNESIN